MSVLIVDLDAGLGMFDLDHEVTARPRGSRRAAAHDPDDRQPTTSISVGLTTALTSIAAR